MALSMSEKALQSSSSGTAGGTATLSDPSRYAKLPEVLFIHKLARRASLDPPNPVATSSSRSRTLPSTMSSQLPVVRNPVGDMPTCHLQQSSDPVLSGKSRDAYLSSRDRRRPGTSQSMTSSPTSYGVPATASSSLIPPRTDAAFGAAVVGLGFSRSQRAGPSQLRLATDALPSPIPRSLGRASPTPTLALSPSRGLMNPSRKSSAGSLERDPGGHLDLKRLLSRPAAHKASNSSSISGPSDSETSYGSYIRSYVDREGAARMANYQLSETASRERIALQRKASVSLLSPSTRPSTADEPYSLQSRQWDHTISPKQSRNVLRRKPPAYNTPVSASPSSPEEPHSYSSSTLPRSGSSKQRPRLDEAFPATSRRAASTPRDTPASASTSLRSKGASDPVSLTPAGRVAHAYKQQEQRREELAETALSDDRPRTASSQRELPSPGFEEGHSGGPYYTVYGGVVDYGQASGLEPNDDTWMYRPHASVDGAKKTHQSPGMRKSLTRKISGRFKKVVDVSRKDRDMSPSRVIHESEVHGREADWRPYDGYARGRRSDGTPPKSPRTPGRLSIDEFSGVGHGPATRSQRWRSSSKHSPVDALEAPRESEELSRISSRKSRDGSHHEESSPSGKWWKLVKRISTGGLRDKYRPDDAPPPVPALPQDLRRFAEPRTTLDISPKSVASREADEQGVLLSRFMQSRTSLSGVEPSLPASHKPKTSPSRPSTGGHQSSSAPRPSTTTRSSSPVSSDMASSSFFHRPHSPRSSTSSFGDGLPSLPKMQSLSCGQHIVPPSELDRMAADPSRANAESQHEPRNRSRSRSAPMPERMSDSPSSASLPSLPLPPRRRTPSAPSTDFSSSPSVPSPGREESGSAASSSLPLNTLSEFGTLGHSGPPPRPRRSEARKLPHLVLKQPDSFSHTPATPRPRPPPVEDADAANRLSARSYASTAKQVSLWAQSSVSPTSRTQRFREMESPRHALTEEEKVSRWEALLERSERAGGTLHLGGKTLPSEELSTHSEFDS